MHPVTMSRDFAWVCQLFCLAKFLRCISSLVDGRYKRSAGFGLGTWSGLTLSPFCGIGRRKDDLPCVSS